MEFELYQSISESLRRPELYLKLLFIVVTIPLWGPVLRSMWRELNTVLDAEGGLYGNRGRSEIRPRPPGLDPFISVPLGARRFASRARPNAPAPMAARPGGGTGFRSRRP